jgi:hypothetical protein
MTRPLNPRPKGAHSKKFLHQDKVHELFVGARHDAPVKSSPKGRTLLLHFIKISI